MTATDVERIAALETRVDALERQEEREAAEKAHHISIWKAAVIGMLFTILTHVVMHYLHW